MTVTLESDLEAFVRREVDRGDFASISDYVHQMRRQRFEQDQQRRLDELRTALDRGIADAGRLKSVDTTFADLRHALGLDQGNS